MRRGQIIRVSRCSKKTFPRKLGTSLWISVFTSRQGRAHIGLAGDAAFLGKACTGAQTPATVWYGDQPRGACAALLRENSAMSDTPTLFTARTEPEPLQVDAWSHEPLLLSL